MSNPKPSRDLAPSLHRLLLGGLLAAAAGCAGPAPLEAVTLLQHGQCQGVAAGARLISYADLARLRGNSLLSITGGVEPASSADDDQQDPLLVAVSRGPQPTAGYALELDSATLEQGTVLLTVRWQTPMPDTVQAQVITHPCLVVALPRDPVQRIRVVDQNGVEVGDLTVGTPPSDASASQ